MSLFSVIFMVIGISALVAVLSYQKGYSRGHEVGYIDALVKTNQEEELERMRNEIIRKHGVSEVRLLQDGDVEGHKIVKRTIDRIIKPEADDERSETNS